VYTNTWAFPKARQRLLPLLRLLLRRLGSQLGLRPSNEMVVFPAMFDDTGGSIHYYPIIIPFIFHYHHS
jgi:hypothetical protein